MGNNIKDGIIVEERDSDKDMNNKNNNSNNDLTKYIVVAIVAAMVGVGTLLLIFKLYPDFANKTVTNITKTEKEVTVTDKGIADAVDELMDATVIVEITNGGQVAGWGSGFVYKTDDNNAYIITNYHVTDNYREVTIEFTDASTTTGKVIGGDEYTDVSVIKVDKNSIKKTAKIGTTTDLRSGDTVFAIGTPVSMNLKFTVTRGILSGKDRLLPMTSSSNNNIFGNYNTNAESWYINLLQIDASINSGNSGGPLANSNGEVIGITNSKLSSSSIENIGFAVPIEDVENVANQVIEKGEVSRPYAGVGLAEIVQAYKAGLIDSYEGLSGVVIGTVEDNSPAAKAGLKKGDIITKINDHVITSVNYFKYYLNRYKVGDKVTITYTRDGMEHIAELELAKKS